MKRFIGIAVIFALVATSAFAQVRVSGQIRTGATLLMGDNGEDSDVRATGNQQWVDGVNGNRHTQARIQFDAGNNDLGARVRLFSHQSTDPIFGFVWWRPHEMVRLQFGRNPDGDWGGAQITGWGFLGDPMDISVAMERWRSPLLHGGFNSAHNLGFYGGISSQAMLASFFPIDGLTVNVGLPLPHNPNADNADDFYKRINIQVRYDINDIGTVRLTYQGGTGVGMPNVGSDDSPSLGYLNPNTWGSPHTIWASFFSNSLVSGLDFDIGLGFRVPETVDNMDIQAPMDVGLGVRYTTGAFNIRFRTGAQFIGSVKPESGEAFNTPITIGFGILPNYNFGSFRVFLNAGLDIALPQEDGTPLFYDDDPLVAWYVNPYVHIPAGGINFYAGFQLYNGRDRSGNGTPKADANDLLVNWKIPLGVVYNF